MRVTDRDGLTSKVDRFIARADLIEPTGDEIALAARLEESALRAAVQLDTGESQLVALLISRKLPLMLTGDKRAIVALHVINVTDASRRIGCLEQLIHAIIETVPLDRIRAKICAEPQMDKTLTICFACASDTVALESVRECLMSYSRDLESHSGTILIDRPLSQR
jgi:hypothetical protein